MTDSSTPGLDITHAGHRTRLKWHRLRLSLSAPLFSASVMAEGFKVGASMELDLRVRGDGGFVVLHDDDLEHETSGRGPVRRHSGAEIGCLTMRNGGTRPILSEQLADQVTAAHPEAVLQFDMKDRLDRIGERGLAHLTELFSNAGNAIIISGKDLDLIVALARVLPQIPRGIDPTDKLADILATQGAAAVEAEMLADLQGPTDAAMVYLSWPLLLSAAASGLDLVALCQAEGRMVDAWTYNLAHPDAGFTDAEWQQFSALMALRPDQITTDEAPATERAWAARR